MEQFQFDPESNTEWKPDTPQKERDAILNEISKNKKTIKRDTSEHQEKTIDKVMRGIKSNKSVPLSVYGDKIRIGAESLKLKMQPLVNELEENNRCIDEIKEGLRAYDLTIEAFRLKNPPQFENFLEKEDYEKMKEKYQYFAERNIRIMNEINFLENTPN